MKRNGMKYFSIHIDDANVFFKGPHTYLGDDWFKKIKNLQGVRTINKKYLLIPDCYFPGYEWPANLNKEIVFWHKKYGKAYITSFGIVEK